MHEILFRGKNEDNNEWVYGFLVKRPSAICIGEGNPWAISVPPKDPDDNGGEFWVKRETVGQYTGLTDKNNKKIFEGDILQGKNKRLFYVEYNAEICSFVTRAVDGENAAPCMNAGTMKYYAVVGSVHDNSELLKIAGKYADNDTLMPAT